MTDTMEYKGYVARIEYDSDNEISYGIVQNCRDTIHFEGGSTTELEKEFEKSVQAYFDFCKQCVNEPNEPIPPHP